MSKALLVIDIQNDYFPNGAFPLWNAENTLSKIEQAIQQAQVQQVPVILIQHIADKTRGLSPFFNEGTEGAAIHSRILTAAPNAPIVIKHFADSFVHTDLEATLQRLGVDELLVCGMMTQNCVTHTAISKQAEKYQVAIIQDCCTTVTELLHLIALNAVSTRMKLVSLEQAF
ncbi:MAG: isochorismatase family protein [Thiothrix sp.]|nr:MAG: isochorismatase family protein [Thiothrix sp.]